MQFLKGDTLLYFPKISYGTFEFDFIGRENVMASKVTFNREMRSETCRNR